MMLARARMVLLALLAGTAVGVLVPAQASAFVSYYNCVNKPSSQWCDGRANGSFDGLHSWDYNQAYNPGSGSFIVCQGVYKPSTGIWIGSGPSCGSNHVVGLYGNQTCACLEANVHHQAGSPKSINGFADADL